MRLPEQRIKQAILHPKQNVRGLCLRYFTKTKRSADDVFPLVIEAIEQYGWREAFPPYKSFAELGLTDESIRWVLAELNREDAASGTEDFFMYQNRLQQTLADADAELLARHEADITLCDAIDSPTREIITDRIRLLSVDAERCWSELGQWCEVNRNERYTDRVDLGVPHRLVEAIARDGDRYAGRVLSLLEVEVDDFRGHPMKWLEPMAVRLAGLMRLEAAIPMLVAKLDEEGDLLNTECIEALGHIGTDEVVDRIGEQFPQCDWSFRLFATGVLEKIASDRVVELGLELLDAEDDRDIRLKLGDSLVMQCAYEVVEPIRQLILNDPMTGGGSMIVEMSWLRGDFLTLCDLLEVDFPEREAWRNDARRDEERFREGHANVLAALAAGIQSEDLEDEEDLDEDTEPDGMPPPAEPVLRESPRVGRNDPCPCGSGKKFKKCCLRSAQTNLPVD